MRLRVLPGVMFGLLTLMSGNARAQTHVCGAGPGPNEVQVGQTGGGGGVGPAPLCDWKQSQGSARAPQRNPYYWGDPHAPSTLPHGWTASVVDPDNHDSRMSFSFVQGMPNRKAAIDAAMAACRNKGATRCDLIAAVKAR